MLGISPGTKFIGVAVMKEGALVDWGVKAFKGEWSTEKLKRIIQNIGDYIDRYNIKVIVIKCFHPSLSSNELEQVISGIIAFAKERNIECRKCCIKEMKRLCGILEIESKRTVKTLILAHYPEIGKSINFSPKNEAYHMRTIEAVALIHAVLQ